MHDNHESYRKILQHSHMDSNTGKENNKGHNSFSFELSGLHRLDYINVCPSKLIIAMTSK